MKVIKFGAVWCVDCLVMKPVWEDIEAELPELKTEYYDADDNSEKLKEYNITDIPVFIFLDREDGEFLRLKGVQNKDDLIKTIKDNLDK